MSNTSVFTTYAVSLQTVTGQSWGWSVDVTDGLDHDADAAALYKALNTNPLISGASVNKTTTTADQYTADLSTDPITFS